MLCLSNLITRGKRDLKVFPCVILKREGGYDNSCQSVKIFCGNSFFCNVMRILFISINILSYLKNKILQRIRRFDIRDFYLGI